MNPPDSTQVSISGYIWSIIVGLIGIIGGGVSGAVSGAFLMGSSKGRIEARIDAHDERVRRIEDNLRDDVIRLEDKIDKHGDKIDRLIQLKMEQMRHSS